MSAQQRAQEAFGLALKEKGQDYLFVAIWRRAKNAALLWPFFFCDEGGHKMQYTGIQPYLLLEEEAGGRALHAQPVGDFAKRQVGLFIICAVMIGAHSSLASFRVVISTESIIWHARGYATQGVFLESAPGRPCEVVVSWNLSLSHPQTSDSVLIFTVA